MSANAPCAAPPAPTALLLDTNVLLGLALPTHHNAAIARPAVAALEQQGARLCVAAQTLCEFYAVITRPKDAAPPGPNWKTKGTLAALEAFTRRFEFLPDTPATFPQWRQLVEAHAVVSKPSHDTRIAALCLVYGVGILTANTGDFKRYAPSGLTVINPATVAPTPSSPTP